MDLDQCQPAERVAIGQTGEVRDVRGPDHRHPVRPAGRHDLPDGQRLDFGPLPTPQGHHRPVGRNLLDPRPLPRRWRLTLQPVGLGGLQADQRRPSRLGQPTGRRCADRHAAEPAQLGGRPRERHPRSQAHQPLVQPRAQRPRQQGQLLIQGGKDPTHRPGRPHSHAPDAAPPRPGSPPPASSCPAAAAPPRSPGTAPARPPAARPRPSPARPTPSARPFAPAPAPAARPPPPRSPPASPADAGAATPSSPSAPPRSPRAKPLRPRPSPPHASLYPRPRPVPSRQQPPQYITAKL